MAVSGQPSTALNAVQSLHQWKVSKEWMQNDAVRIWQTKTPGLHPLPTQGTPEILCNKWEKKNNPPS